MSSLFETITKSLDGNAVASIAKQLGTDSGTAQSAIGAALPMLLGGLAKNSAAPEGAASLNTALDNHDGSILGNVASAVGSADHQQTGLGMLGHIFGGQNEGIASAISKATGLDAAQAMKLLATLAPLVMGALGQQRAATGGSSGLSSLLQAGLGMAQQQAPAGAQGMLGNVLGMLGNSGSAGGGLGGMLGGLMGGASQPQNPAVPGAPASGGAADALSGMLGGLLK